MRFLTLALTLLPISVLSIPLDIKRASGESLPPPSKDPFYKVPAFTIGFYQKGQVVDKRDVTTNVEGDNVASSYQVSYRSLTTKQNPDLTVATIWTPSKKSVPTKIFSYQTYEDSTNLDCAPSWAYTDPTDSKNTFPTSVDSKIYIEYALSKGWYVVAADFEGSQSAFISGRQQGQAVLDGVRALMNSENLAKNSQVGLLGYSGGGSATVWANNLHDSYAPELNIIGSVHGGTPIDTKNLFNFLNKSFFAGFAGAGVVGLTNAYPELDKYIQKVTTLAGKAALAKFRQSGYCFFQVALGNPFTDFYKYITVDDPLDQPIPAAVLAQETLLIDNAASPSLVSTPKFPRFIFHAKDDGIIPIEDVESYVKQQCSSGGDISYSTVPGEHILGEILGLIPAISWITKAFEGTEPRPNCGTAFDAPNMDSQEARDLIGEDNINYLKSFNGKSDKTIFNQEKSIF